MSFDDDAAGDAAGFRPPPHPDDRLWRHPSELRGDRQVGLAPQPRHHWPWAIVALVGTATVLIAGAGALVLGFRTDTGTGERTEQAGTTVGSSPTIAPQSWLGIEGYDRLGAAAEESPAPPPPSVAAAPEVSATTTPSTDDGAPSDDTAGDDPDLHADVATTTTTVAFGGVTVSAVDPDGPSADTLQPGDVVLEVDGQPVADMDELLDALDDYQPGDRVLVTYVGSHGGPSTAVVTLAERPATLR